VDLPAPDPANLEGDIEELTDILDVAAGLIVAGGPDPALARRLVHALARAIAERHGDTVLLASVDETYKHADEAGVVLRTAPGLVRPAIAALEPGTLVVDPTAGEGELRLEDLERVPRLLAGSVAPTPEAMASRCLARLAGGSLEKARAALGALPLALVWTASTEEDVNDIPFDCWQLESKDRALVFGVDVSALASKLRPGSARPPRTPLPTR
jgi:hypothetical protein